MKVDVTRELATLGGSLGQDAVAVTPQASYQEVWDQLFATCQTWLGEDECRRLMGYTPFVCPVPTQKPMTAHWWFWLGAGALAGVIAGKLF